jgi:hypothetical protein
MELYLEVYTLRLLENNVPEMLKVQLKIHYDIEPTQIPRTLPYQRLGYLRVLLSTFDPTPSANPLPKHVQKLMVSVYYHLRRKLVKEMAKSWGTRYEMRHYEQDFGEKEALTREGKLNSKDCDYIPLEGNEDAKNKFVEDMNKLLEWAGIKAKSAEELV